MIESQSSLPIQHSIVQPDSGSSNPAGASYMQDDSDDHSLDVTLSPDGVSNQFL